MPDIYGSPAFADVEPADYGELLDLLQRRPAWHADAACREAPASVSWFPAAGGDAAPARAIARRGAAA